MVHGGQQPVVGAHVYLYAAGTAANAGYDASGNLIPPSSSNASTSLLDNRVSTNNPGMSGVDSLGYYVQTDASGSFSINEDYTCAVGTQLYLYVLGGNTGSGTNSSAAFLSVLGQCPSGGSLAGIVPYVWINEVSTVAAAYAFAGYATDATHVSSDVQATPNTSSGEAGSGIANAFANASQLVAVDSGNAVLTTAAGNIAPQAMVNTLADILAVCVNTNDENTMLCSKLFGYALSGGTTGTTPTDTATAAINIAHNPGANVSHLFELPSGIAAPFLPALPSEPEPTDFTLGIQTPDALYGSGAITDIDLDGSGNAWIAATSRVVHLASQGHLLGTFATGTNGLSTPTAVAVEPTGNVWIANQGSGSIVGISSAGSILTGTSGWPLANSATTATSLALDGNDNLWVSDGTHDTLQGMNTASSGTLLTSGSGLSLGGGTTSDVAVYPNTANSTWNVWARTTLGATYIISSGTDAGITGSPFTTGYQGVPHMRGAFDAAGNYWFGADADGKFGEVTPSGTSTSLSVGDISAPHGIAIDGSGHLWVSDSSENRVYETNASGTLLSTTQGYTGGTPHPDACNGAIAVDSAGDVWIGGTADGASYTTMLVGAATPVLTPKVKAVALSKVATRP